MQMLEHVLDQQRSTQVDLIKMDIEGTEKLILRGHPVWLCSVNVLLVELHGKDQEEMVRDIQSAGLHVNLDGSQVCAWRK